MDRDELHELVMLLKEAVSSGSFKLQPGSTATESLKRVQFLPDGKADPDSVDSAVRAASLAAALKHEREKQQLSLRDTQTHYFELVNSAFGELFDQMKAHQVTANDIALDFGSRPAAVNAFIADYDNFAETINDFWEYHGQSVQRQVQELKALKSIFGGDVFPSYAANIASSVGLYMDTIVFATD